MRRRAARRIVESLPAAVAVEALGGALEVSVEKVLELIRGEMGAPGKARKKRKRKVAVFRQQQWQAV